MKIIAEVGSNWKTLQDCLHSQYKAKECGADAVKFQMFTRAEMYKDGQGHHIGSSPYLDHDWIPTLKQHADILGIEFMCTAFSDGGYHFINKYVDTHKIASAEITDLNILDMVNSFGKPVYLSTGGATIKQIETAIERLKNCPVTLMYCVTAYPAKIVDFKHLLDLVHHFKRSVSYGYSDHSIDVLNIPRLAQHHGAIVIEKHVNFTDHQDTDDAPHSLNTQEFALMVKSIHGDEISLSETFRPCGWQRKAVQEGDKIRFYRTKV